MTTTWGQVVFGCVLAAVAGGRAVQAEPIIAGEDVADRAHPGYAPLPIPLGGFDLFPMVTVGANYNDNVLATATNRQGDLFFDVRPEVRFRSHWARNSLRGTAHFDQTVYTRLTNQNTSAYGIDATGLLDVSRATQIQADVTVERRAENLAQLGAFRGASRPARYDHLGATLALSQGFNKLTLRAAGSVQRFAYQDISVGGVSFSQLYRNVTSLDGTGSATYKLTPSVGLVGTVQVSRRHYDFHPGSTGFVTGLSLDRASTGLTLQGGVRLELSSLIFGTIQAGYYKTRYRDPRLRDPAGFNINADLLWNVTPLTSLNFHAARSIQDSSSTVFAGNTRLDFSASVNHELYRYVLLQADAGYAHYTPNGRGFSGNEYTIGAGVRYLVDRRFTINASLRHSQRDTADLFAKYRRFQARIGVGFTI